MLKLLDRITVLIFISAFVVTVLCIFPLSRNMLPFSIMARGMFVGDALFHEMGHTTFFWLFGQPAIPMIFTLFGSDQAGGMSMPLMEHNWFMQIIAFMALGYGCYWVKNNIRHLYIPALCFTAFIFIIAITGYQQLVIAYMGHGSSIFMGGFFLFRAWIYLDARNTFERWLNAFFGFYLTLSNLAYSYSLAFNREMMGDYADHVAFGASHNDFWMMAMQLHSFSIKGIAIFTIGYCVATIIGSFFVAAYLQDDFDNVNENLRNIS